VRICVFCASSDAVDEHYFEEARDLGREMARRGHQLVYGGGRIGAMGAVARAVKQGGGRVVGVIPHALNDLGLGYPDAGELILTESMRQRKAVMEANSDAFVALPGGLGTFDELLEIANLKMLRYHTKPVAVVDSSGYYGPLVALLEHAVNGRFAKPEALDLIRVCCNSGTALDYVESYRPTASAADPPGEALPPDAADPAVE
jgi:uncharacterized protein (TIGR00730 family)